MGKYIKTFSTQADYTAAQANLDLPNVSLITENMTVEFNPYVEPAPTYEMVDLGLPSGLKWAKCNIGADTETDYGLYFSWGGTTGYADATTKNFTFSDYELGDGGDRASNMTKYNLTDGKTTLEPVDDAAYQATNGALRMPTETEVNELLNTAYVTNAWVTNYNGSGVNGRLLTSVSNGNTLFIPASGYCGGGVLEDRGDYGYVWTSSVYADSPDNSRYLDIGSNNIKMYNRVRRFGYNIRGVSL